MNRQTVLQTDNTKGWTESIGGLQLQAQCGMMSNAKLKQDV